MRKPPMLDFEFSPTQTEYREQLREFALRELLPGYQQREEEGRYPSDEVRRVIRFTNDFWKGREDERAEPRAPISEPVLRRSLPGAEGALGAGPARR
jgi:hypothetical protein